jgi:hypothetical protein
MRYMKIAIIGMLFSLLGCSDNIGLDSGILGLPWYNVYEGYSYGGPRPSTDTSLFFQTTNKDAFDSLFFFIYDHNIYDPIPPAELSSRKVVSIVKYGNNIYILKIQKIEILDGTLEIIYTSTLENKNMSWTAAISLIITLNADYHRIRFVENGKIVKEIVPQ